MLLFSATAMAADDAEEDKNTLICRIMGIYNNLLLPIGAVISIVVLAFGGLKFMTAANDPMAKDQAKQMMMGAIVGLLIVVLAPQIVGAVYPEMHKCVDVVVS